MILTETYLISKLNICMPFSDFSHISCHFIFPDSLAAVLTSPIVTIVGSSIFSLAKTHSLNMYSQLSSRARGLNVCASSEGSGDTSLFEPSLLVNAISIKIAGVGSYGS